MKRRSRHLRAVRSPEQRGQELHLARDGGCAFGLLLGGADPDHIPCEMRALERGDEPRTGVELPSAESVSSGCGNAWWLLCQASPNASGASHARLRDRSRVAKGRRPKVWQGELMLKVA
jgi:hypothetical protein